jgi:hypothetical protein
MPNLFGRTVVVSVGGTTWTDLDVSFDITRTTKHTPNKGKIDLYNLSASTRATLEQSGRGQVVKLVAGYKTSTPSTLFLATLRRASTARNGADLVTSIEADDGGVAYCNGRVNRSYAAGTLVATALQDLVADMGIGPGNLSSFSSRPLEGAGTSFPLGTVFSGRAADELDGLLRSMGLRWSVQNYTLQIQDRGQPVPSAQVVMLSEESGLIGAPSADQRGVVSADSLILPGLDPGGKVSLRSAKHNGGFEIREVQTIGSTFGKEFYAKLKLRPY